MNTTMLKPLLGVVVVQLQNSDGKTLELNNIVHQWRTVLGALEIFEIPRCFIRNDLIILFFTHKFIIAM